MTLPRSTNDWAGLSVSQSRYLVRAQLGEGGMAFVYRALDKNLDADVVLKVPRRSMLDDPEFASRFAREVRSLVKLSHPGIVKVTDVGEHDGVPFAVMQYLSGGSLEDYAATDRTDSSVQASLSALSDWLSGIAAALDFVHSQGYVHRDVKPGNILFDAYGHAFLSDFGVAKVMAAEPASASGRGQTAVTGAGLVCGTAGYMAPELIMGESIDGRIDQYALAVTVYQMLAGRLPFEASSPTACMVLHTTRQAPPLSAVEPRVPRGVSDAVARALSKDPAVRFPTCATFAAAVLSALAAGEGQRIRPVRHARSDQVRLECPSCSKTLVFPASLMADPEKGRRKRFSCPACKSHLRLSDDGGTLVVSGPGSSTQVLAPPRVTQKVAVPRDATVLMSRPPVAPTQIQASPVPSVGANPTVVSLPAVRRMQPVQAVAAGGVLLVLLAAVITAVDVIPAWSAPRTGVVHVDATAVPEGAVFTLDGQPMNPSTAGAPLVLHAGAHELVVTRDGFTTFERHFPVSAGEESGFKVLMPREAPPLQLKEEKTSTASAEVEATTPEETPPPPEPARASLVMETKHPRPCPPFPTARVDRAGSQTLSLIPVPDGPPVDKETLSTLLQKPSAFADRVFVPTGLYLLGPISLGNPDGLATTTVSRIALHARTKNIAYLEPIESPVPVRVDLDLANHLRSLADPRVGQPRNIVVGRWGETASVLTFHVQRRAGSDNDDALPVLKRVEFLVGMNFFRVGEGNFKDAFKTITATPTGAPHLGLSDRHDWSTRLGVPYTTQLKHIVHNYKDAKFYREMQLIQNAMAPGFGAVIGNSVLPPQPRRVR